MIFSHFDNSLLGYGDFQVKRPESAFALIKILIVDILHLKTFNKLFKKFLWIVISLSFEKKTKCELRNLSLFVVL